MHSSHGQIVLGTHRLLDSPQPSQSYLVTPCKVVRIIRAVIDLPLLQSDVHYGGLSVAPVSIVLNHRLPDLLGLAS